MIPAVEVAGARVFLGDCREVLKHLPDNSVDSVVTDPPYELNFMNRKWDNTGVAYDVTVWQECLRVLKPGGHVLAFGGSRTWHRLAVAVEDAGFELRDSIAWIYGSGFPKSLDVSKAIDKKAGAEREVVTERSEDLLGEHENPKIVTRTGKDAGTYGAMTGISPQTIAATSEAKAWEGWGTALKPAFEPVVVGRKPFGKGVTVAENVLEWGVGGLNIDGSRIATTDNLETYSSQKVMDNQVFGKGLGVSSGRSAELQGRWPANVILDEVTAGLLDEQSGQLSKRFTDKAGLEGFAGGGGAFPTYADGQNMGASRFFYVAKASKRDRNEGLEDPNAHPTVKPTQLMRYLIKLVTPAGGTVLDPFTGSGSTGKAALLDGLEFVGAELTEEYLPIIEGRLRWASEQVEETDDTLF